MYVIFGYFLRRRQSVTSGYRQLFYICFLRRLALKFAINPDARSSTTWATDVNNELSSECKPAQIPARRRRKFISIFSLLCPPLSPPNSHFLPPSPGRPFSFFPSLPPPSLRYSKGQYVKLKTNRPNSTETATQTHCCRRSGIGDDDDDDDGTHTHTDRDRSNEGGVYVTSLLSRYFLVGEFDEKFVKSIIRTKPVSSTNPYHVR